MGNWPLERIMTLSEGIPIPAKLINRMQDGTNQIAGKLHDTKIPVNLATRVNHTGTWTIAAEGYIHVATNLAIAYVFFSPPVGVRLKKVTVIGRQESAANARFATRLLEISSIATISALSIYAESNGVTTAADQTVESEIADGYITVAGRRYCVDLATSGGGVTQRSIVSATVHYEIV